MQRDSRSPKTYRADVSGEQRKLLDGIREVIFEVAPDVEEGIEHGMLDFIAERSQMREALIRSLQFMMGTERREPAGVPAVTTTPAEQ